MVRFIPIFIFFLYCTNLKSQIVVSTNSNQTQLVNEFLGTGITLSGSPSKFCNSNGTALFNNGLSTSCPMDSGIVLCTGYASFLNRSVSYAANAGLNYGMNDIDLMQLSPYSNTDICYLQFNFIPTQDSLVFQYVFGSEEYLEWVGSVFNDVFGFFITGPNPYGGNYNKLNLAKVPGSPDIVSINSINHISNSSYYINNYPDGAVSGVNDPGFVLDGFTQLMNIGIGVIPGATYTIKLAIGDVSDPMLDSYVLLRRSSFRSVPSSGTLPVVLTEFNVTKNQKSALISWETASEDNTDYFSIEHSNNAIDWSSITEIDASGNISTGAQYSYQHDNLSENWNYYRLKIIDLDGNFSYSDPKVIDSKNEETVKIFPTIIHNEDVTIDLSSLKDNSMLEIYTAEGELVRKLNLNNSTHKINFQKLSSGVYLLNLKNELTNINQTIIKH